MFRSCGMSQRTEARRLGKRGRGRVEEGVKMKVRVGMETRMETRTEMRAEVRTKAKWVPSIYLAEINK
jgi:hypothetical protein